jgi:hypothetical protein
MTKQKIKRVILKISMKALAVGLCLLTCGGIGQIQQNSSVQFFVNIPTAEKEAEFVYSLIYQIKFFDENGYNISLPDVPLINSLKSKVYKGMSLSKDDLDELINLFKNELFDEEDYKISLSVVQSAALIADQHLDIFHIYARKWDFFIPPKYNITLSLYGPGGSYNPINGNISMKITKDGTFFNEPLSVMLHEAFHIGIENRIIQKYNVPHWTKERIVDQFMYHKMRNIVPNYRMQPGADTSIDIIFQDNDIFEDLPERIRVFIENINKQK